MAREFAEAIKAQYPEQMLVYNCSPSFNWKKHLDDSTIAKFQREFGHIGSGLLTQLIPTSGLAVSTLSSAAMAA